MTVGVAAGFDHGPHVSSGVALLPTRVDSSSAPVARQVSRPKVAASPASSGLLVQTASGPPRPTMGWTTGGSLVATKPLPFAHHRLAPTLSVEAEELAFAGLRLRRRRRAGRRVSGARGALRRLGQLAVLVRNGPDEAATDRDRFHLVARQLRDDARAPRAFDAQKQAFSARSGEQIAVLGDRQRDDLVLRAPVVDRALTARIDVEDLSFGAGGREQAGAGAVGDERPHVARAGQRGEGLGLAVRHAEDLSVGDRRGVNRAALGLHEGGDGERAGVGERADRAARDLVDLPVRARPDEHAIPAERQDGKRRAGVGDGDRAERPAGAHGAVGPDGDAVQVAARELLERVEHEGARADGTGAFRHEEDRTDRESGECAGAAHHRRMHGQILT